MSGNELNNILPYYKEILSRIPENLAFNFYTNESCFIKANYTK